MNPFTQKLMQLAASILFALPLGGCATTFTLSSEPIDGVVREEGTNKPIPGAIVVVRWQGHLGYTGTVCYHVETTTTDAEGKYRISAWSKPSPYGNISDRTWLSSAYKPGYQSARVQRTKGVVILQPFAGTREERLRKTAGAAVTCASAGESQKNLLPLYRKLYEETRALAVTKNDKLIVNDLLRQIDLIELPYKEVLKRADERNKALRKEFPNE